MLLWLKKLKTFSRVFVFFGGDSFLRGQNVQPRDSRLVLNNLSPEILDQLLKIPSFVLAGHFLVRILLQSQNLRQTNELRQKPIF